MFRFHAFSVQVIFGIHNFFNAIFFKKLSLKNQIFRNLCENYLNIVTVCFQWAKDGGLVLRQKLVTGMTWIRPMQEDR